jgi:hypothetical protein
MRRAVLFGLLATLLLCLFVSESLAEDFTLTPSSTWGEKPVENGVTVLCSSPTGWEEDRNPDSEYAGSKSAKVFLNSLHKSRGSPYIVISSSIRSTHDSGDTVMSADPKNSEAAMWLDTATEIEGYKKLEVFDAGPNGKLPVWLIRSKGNDCNLTILIVRGPIRVEVSGMMEDEDHLLYIDALKEFARSVRFAKAARQAEPDAKP